MYSSPMVVFIGSRLVSDVPIPIRSTAWAALAERKAGSASVLANTVRRVSSIVRSPGVAREYASGALPPEIPGAHRHANQVDNQPARRDAGDLIDVGTGRDFDHIHADHAPLLHQPVDQLAGLHEGDAAGT